MRGIAERRFAATGGTLRICLGLPQTGSSMQSFAPILEQIAANPDERSTLPLLDLIRVIRPRRLEPAGSAAQRLRAMISLLHSRPHLARGLRIYVQGVFGARIQSSLFADLGILANQTVGAEVFRRLISKFLPPAYDDTYLHDLFAGLTRVAGDHLWLQELPEELIAELLRVIGLGGPEDNTRGKQRTSVELLEALRVLSLRLAAIGVEPDFLRYDDKAASRESPFVAQAAEVHGFVSDGMAAITDEALQWPDDSHLDVLLDQCETHLRRIRALAHEGGASVALTYDSFRASQIIRRMHQLNDLARPDDSENQQRHKIAFFRELMEHEAEKNSIRALLRQVTDLLALRVTDHAGKTGEHYVATTRAESRQMFYAAAGAGFIVGFMALFKLFIARAKLPPIWEALGFSLNYGLGFVIVHLCHFTIATKQPAMTAATITASLDEGRRRDPPLQDLENLVVDVARTQFIAIMGNVLAAMLTCFAIGAAWTWVFGVPEINAEKAQHLLHDIHPWQSLAIPHAAIAGVCLYLAGLISGYYDNKCVYSRIPQRVRQLRWLGTILGTRGRDRLAAYLEKNLGALAGNFLFGCMLGCMGTLGFLIGLPLDIRHVTFAAANYAYALMALDFQVPWQTVVACGAGVLLIGLTNLAVSFSLALFTALKARQVRFRHSRKLFGMVARRFLRRPWEFFVSSRAPDAASQES
ncbi:site-specific recombinase [Niveibacterium sp. SC-1]|uniref:site-specific recombinase n=1 Tax=Niveibacterium sp. SC-1 TaxID=3135646 RepID=UPI00311FB27D